MKEFYLILKIGGFFTAIWNPRNIESSSFHMKIELLVYDEVETKEEVSFGNKLTSDEMEE